MPCFRAPLARFSSPAEDWIVAANKFMPSVLSISIEVFLWCFLLSIRSSVQTQQSFDRNPLFLSDNLEISLGFLSDIVSTLLLFKTTSMLSVHFRISSFNRCNRQILKPLSVTKLTFTMLQLLEYIITI